MTAYAQHFSTRQTPQSEPVPGSAQVANSAGGYSFAVTDWTRLDRFLVLGSEGGSYYASERELTKQSAEAVLRCVRADGPAVVRHITAVSESGRAPKNDPAVFALALAAGCGDAATKELALAALPRVCRTGTHLFQFAQSVQAFRGWGRGLRGAVASWYTAKDPRELAYQLVKYQARGGWSHRDLLRLSHPKPRGRDPMAKDLNRALLAYAAGKQGDGWLPPERELEPVYAFEAAKRAATVEEVVRLIRDHGLVRECVKTEYLNDPRVWDALLERMPLTAMVRNLATMTRVGLLKPLSAAADKVAAELGDAGRLRASRLHPMALLLALKTYASGRGVKSGQAWSPVAQVVDALDAAFYAAFANVEPAGKRWLLALDVSGSMGAAVAGTPLTCREASAALALVTMAAERQSHCVAFTTTGWTGGLTGQYAHMGYQNGVAPLPISPRQRLGDAVAAVSGLPFGGTDCALPMLYALEHGVEADVFVVLTDSETWAGNVHPCQALRAYREKTGIPAKLIVVGMVANGFSIADPGDAGMLDVVGFDAAVPALMADFARG